jgi:hypothetical protein
MGFSFGASPGTPGPPGPSGPTGPDDLTKYKIIWDNIMSEMYAGLLYRAGLRGVSATVLSYYSTAVDALGTFLNAGSSWNWPQVAPVLVASFGITPPWGSDPVAYKNFNDTFGAYLSTVVSYRMTLQNAEIVPPGGF